MSDGSANRRCGTQASDSATDLPAAEARGPSTVQRSCPARIIACERDGQTRIKIDDGEPDLAPGDRVQVFAWPTGYRSSDIATARVTCAREALAVAPFGAIGRRVWVQKVPR